MECLLCATVVLKVMQQNRFKMKNYGEGNKTGMKIRDFTEKSFNITEGWPGRVD